MNGDSVASDKRRYPCVMCGKDDNTGTGVCSSCARTRLHHAGRTHSIRIRVYKARRAA